MSAMYTCAVAGCRAFFCRNAAAGQTLGAAILMANDCATDCDSDENGHCHTCAHCCSVTAARERDNAVAVASGWVAFLDHCAEHGAGCNVNL